MVTVRPQRLDDCDAVAANHIAAWRVAYRGIVPDDALAKLDVTAWAARRRETFATGPRTFVAVDDADRPIGHVMVDTYRIGRDIARRDASVGEIWAIYVHPGHWDAGVGRLLLRAGLAGLPQPEVRLWVLEANLRARRFYERNGLYPDGTRESFTPRGSEIQLPELRYAIRR